jgi:DNA helicase-2/ATP-dependent DNA helicase PcrA
MKKLHSKTIKIFGPPGTGKTTKLLGRVEKYLERGVKPNEVAYFSFTRKAVKEAVERFKFKFPFIKDEDLNNVRTIHSFCRQSFREIPVMDDDGDMREFEGGMGNISLEYDDSYSDVRIRKNWPLRIYDKARNMMIDPVLAYRRERVKKVSLEKYINTIKSYEEFKQQHRVDFTDMIERYIEVATPPNFKLLIIDEAQDLTPLQWKFVYKLAEAAERVYVAGDDDQAIYEWNGALVKIFQEFPGRKVVLKYSHRLNKQIHSFAKLIRTKIKNTEEKEFNCGLGEGNVMLFKKFQEIPFHAFTGKWYILARIRECVKELTDEAQKIGLYYENVKGKKSFDIYQYKAIKIWTDLIGGRAITKDDAVLCYEYIQEIARGYRKLDSKAWLEIDPNYLMDFETLQVVGGLETTKKKEPWYDAFNRKFSDPQKRYFFKMEKLNIDLNTKANIIIDTIHQVKGGEAENVVLYAKTNWPSDFDGKNLDAKSNEARVWYTGSTRSKKNLFLLGTTHKYSFPLAQIYNTYMENINEQ